VLKHHAHEVVVCNSRRNALLKEGSKSDRVDARKLAELLRGGPLQPVYHGEHGLRTLRELGRSYQTISKDLRQVKEPIGHHNCEARKLRGVPYVDREQIWLVSSKGKLRQFDPLLERLLRTLRGATRHFRRRDRGTGRERTLELLRHHGPAVASRAITPSIFFG